MGHLAVRFFYYSPARKLETFGPHIDAVTSLRGWESSRLRLHLDGDGFSLHTPGWLRSLLIDRLSSSPPASRSGLISPDGHAGIKGIGGEGVLCGVIEWLSNEYGPMLLWSIVVMLTQWKQIMRGIHQQVMNRSGQFCANSSCNGPTCSAWALWTHAADSTTSILGQRESHPSSCPYLFLKTPSPTSLASKEYFGFNTS